MRQAIESFLEYLEAKAKLQNRARKTVFSFPEKIKNSMIFFL